MDEEIITQIGTLEWNVSDRYIMTTDLEKIRPTIEEDKVAERPLNSLQSPPE